MNLDFFAREEHHKKHAQAIANGFGLKVKSEISDLTADYVAVFCYGDLVLVNRKAKKIIFCEHGAGMFYNNKHSSYAGSIKGRENVVLRLSPNETHAQEERKTLNCPVEVIGIPYLDKYANRNFRVRRRIRPIVAISFHWDCLVNQETRTSFNYFVSALDTLKYQFTLIGHGHPRIMRCIEPIYRKKGIKSVRDFSTVIEKADVYICDNSSTIYEWGITKKPIVVLNPPFYRKSIEHKGNPRFWKHSTIGPLCERPEDLARDIFDAINNHDIYLPKILEANKDVLTFTDGKCTERAVEAIKKHIPYE